MLNFVSHRISNLLLGEKTVRVAEGDAPNSFGKSGKTAWACLWHAHSLVHSEPLGSILVREGGIEPPSTHWKCVVLPLYHTRNYPIIHIFYYFKTSSIQALIFLAKNTPNSFLPLLLTERCAVPYGNLPFLKNFLFLRIST